MRLKAIILGLTAAFLCMNAADVLQSPYLQFSKKMIPAVYATNPSAYVAGQQGTPAWKAALREFAAQIRKNYDHTDIRLGREVILTPDVELIQS